MSAEELNEEIALAHATSTESATTFSYYSDDDDKSNGETEYEYYEYDEEEDTTVAAPAIDSDDGPQKIIVRVERPPTATTTTSTRSPLTETSSTTKSNPFKDLIEDIESHYILRGRYMSEQEPGAKRKKVLLENRKITNYDYYGGKKKTKQQSSGESNRYMSSSANDDDNNNSVSQVESGELERHKEKHAMRYRAEDDTIIDEILIDEMDKIMKDGESSTRAAVHHQGACFNGQDSYFHYSDAETMRRVISYQIDLNLRFKTHSSDGVILWTGRHSAKEDDDFLSLGIENG